MLPASEPQDMGAYRYRGVWIVNYLKVIALSIGKFSVECHDLGRFGRSSTGQGRRVS